MRLSIFVKLLATIFSKTETTAHLIKHKGQRCNVKGYIT